MTLSKNALGWREVNIRDSFLSCPIDSLPMDTQIKAKDTIGSYNLFFTTTMVQKRLDDVHVLLPDFYAQQPLHVFCTVATNFDSNKLTLLEAIKQDRKRATKELSQLQTENAKRKKIEKAKLFLSNLFIVEKVALEGQETSLAEDVEALVPDELKNGYEVAKEKGVKYYSYNYPGFRPFNLVIT